MNSGFMCTPNLSGFWNTAAFAPNASSATSSSGIQNSDGSSKTMFTST
jgi:hypothetical protein